MSVRRFKKPEFTKDAISKWMAVVFGRDSKKSSIVFSLKGSCQYPEQCSMNMYNVHFTLYNVYCTQVASAQDAVIVMEALKSSGR